MSQQFRGKLYGCIQLISSADSFGIPLFQSHLKNTLLLPETDHNLRIVRFLEIDPSPRYRIVPYGHAPEPSYEIGYPVPIPYWVDGKLDLVGSDASPMELFTRFGSKPKGIVAELVGLIERAQSGAFPPATDTQERFQALFQDVLEEQPVHSRYWIARYRSAVASASSNEHLPKEAEEALRIRAREWLHRFVTRTTVRYFQGILENHDGKFFHELEARWYYFAFAASLARRQKFQELFVLSRSTLYSKLLPRGLYWHWLDGVANPNANVGSMLPNDAPESFELLEVFKSAMYESVRKDDFRKLKQLASILFGDRDAPKDINEFLSLPIARKSEELKHFLNHRLNEMFHRDPNAEETAAHILGLYKSLHQIDGILYGDSRYEENPKEYRFGMSPNELEDLQRLVSYSTK